MTTLNEYQPCQTCGELTKLADTIGTLVVPKCLKCRNEQVYRSHEASQRWSVNDPGVKEEAK